MEHREEGKNLSFEECARFHGHACPGLAFGYRAALAGMHALGAGRACDDELVCIAETDACSVDAVQVMAGCTAGKGNLAIRYFGKNAFTFISRRTGEAVRVSVRPSCLRDREEMDSLRRKVSSGGTTEGDRGRLQALMQSVIAHILAAPEDAILEVRRTEAAIPERARIFQPITCARCGEEVADVKTVLLESGRVCIPCARELLRKRGNRNT